MLFQISRVSKSFVLVLLIWLQNLPPLVKSEAIQLYGLNYNTRQGPDWDPFRCKTYEQVRLELSVLSQITNRIRLLSLIDCNQGPMVLDAAKELGMELWLGLWVTNITHVFPDELNALKWMIEQGMLEGNTVQTITVGSEAVYREEVTAAEIVEHKEEVSEVLLEAGYGDIPVGICDVDDTYEANIDLFQGTDIVVANAFPFWERTPVDVAVDFFVNSKWPPILNLANWQEKDVVIGETGWASDGENPAASDATPENQATYLRDFYCQIDRELGWKYFYFTGIDNTWRQEQEYWHDDWVEGHFGIFYSNMTLKPHFADLEFSCPGSDTVYSFDINPVPTASPTNAPPEACSANPSCLALGLVGNCCPAPNGAILGCCDDDIVERTTDGPTTPPSLEPTATQRNNTQSPTQEPVDPTLAPTLFPSLSTTGPTSLITPTAAPIVPLPSSDTPTVGAPSISPTQYQEETGLNFTLSPTEAPSSTPSLSPSVLVSDNPSSTPPTVAPSSQPTTSIQTTVPSLSPTTEMPSRLPSSLPTQAPSAHSTTGSPISEIPTTATSSPTLGPTNSPTLVPTTSTPSSVPTGASKSPTDAEETESPTAVPNPTATPTSTSTDTPSLVPTAAPLPSLLPTRADLDGSSAPSDRPVASLDSAAITGSSSASSRKTYWMLGLAIYFLFP